MNHAWETLSRCAACWALAILSVSSGACGDSIADPSPSPTDFGEDGSPGTGGTKSGGTMVSGAGGGPGPDNAGGGNGGQGGGIQVDDPCASLTAPGAPAARVVWVTGGDQSLEVTTPLAFSWAFQYAVRIPKEDAGEYMLVYERCETPAGESLRCISGELAMEDTECSVRHAPKFGLDPSGYKPGRNVYGFALYLMHGSRVASRDSFTMELLYMP